MNQILYDLLVKGILPIGAITLFEFIFKKYLNKNKNNVASHLFGSFNIIVGLFYVYGALFNFGTGIRIFEYEPYHLRLSGEFNEVCSFKDCV
ncbi:hypothetical protein HYX08_02065 [Candidatus Woesearchaeota archaeon]|nr:hypothetical protein [Candidatus Woesearchaeota archaeon]